MLKVNDFLYDTGANSSHRLPDDQFVRNIYSLVVRLLSADFKVLPRVIFICGDCLNAINNVSVFSVLF